MALEEKGIAYELQPVALEDPEYERLHPFRRMAAFRHGDYHLYETGAIAAYVDESFEGPRLQPADTRQRARMVQWIGVVNDNVDRDVVRRCVLEHVFPTGADGKPDTEKIRAALACVRPHLGVMERALGASRYPLRVTRFRWRTSSSPRSWAMSRRCPKGTR